MKKILALMIGLSLFVFAGCGETNQENDNKGEQNLGGDTTVSQNQPTALGNSVAPATPAGIKSKDQKADVLAADPTDLAKVTNADGAVELKFKNTNSDEYISSLNGKKVTMTGYISTLSPVNGKFAYLMNMPYQSCPYCVPGTSQVYNTIAIYAKGNGRIEFTNDPVTVEGKLQTGTFTDEFGYEYGVKIADVTVKKADVSKLSKNILMYSALTQDGSLDEINAIINDIDLIVYYDYYEYYYQYKPEDLIAFDTSRVDTIISKLKAISTTDYADIISVLQSAKTVAEKANKNLETKAYEKNKDYQPDLDAIFQNFSAWMAKYEL